MLPLFVVFLSALGVFLLFWLVFPKRSADTPKPTRYICSHCGEKHCDCHPQENLNNKESVD